MSKSVIKRTAIQEWVRWQMMTAAFFLGNGGFYSMFWPYYTFSFSSMFPRLGPVIQYGPAKSDLFPLAPFPAITGTSIPLCGVIALIAGVVIFCIESDQVPGMEGMHENNAVKIVLYLLIGLVCINEFTCVSPSLFCIFASICLMIDSSVN
ncbi:hypothetical protein HDV02_001206 [Globomyces sp. JEL0801]|nr:hypothetical protein HDV02_001206 [Globomyces sp. JEL0801]